MYKKSSKSKKTYRPRKARRSRQYRGYGRRPNTPVFSETYVCGTECPGLNADGEVLIGSSTTGQGVRLITAMNKIPQNGSYSALYNGYKILKAVFTIIPRWTGESLNQAENNIDAGAPAFETPRIAQSVQDLTADVSVAPASEDIVLRENGCKVKMFTKPIKIKARVKPNLIQVVGPSATPATVFSDKNPYISWDLYGPTVPHGTADVFISTNQVPSGYLSVAKVYCTVTFALRDPR